MSQLLFNELIEELSRRGFVIGVDHHLRLQRLLNSLGADCAPLDLRSLLCPIFATNRKQQVLFYQIFDRYFEALSPEAGKRLSLPGKREKVLGKSERLSKIPYVVLRAILILLIALFPLWRRPGPVPPGGDVTTTVPSSSTTTVLPDTQTTPVPPKPVPTVPDLLPETPEPPQRGFWNWKTRASSRNETKRNVNA